MVICRKVESQELLETSGTNGRNGRRPKSPSEFQGGPVFLPPRPPSPLAQALLASVEGTPRKPREAGARARRPS